LIKQALKTEAGKVVTVTICMLLAPKLRFRVNPAVMPADKFLKLVEWSQQDQCYVGSSPGLIGPCCHGKDEARVYKQLCQIIDEWVEIYQQDGRALPESFADKTFSGKFVLRVDEGLHKALSIKAIKSGESLNTFCANKLRDALLSP
jgi:predicted HicB family RNase H-like nuclease